MASFKSSLVNGPSPAESLFKSAKRAGKWKSLGGFLLFLFIVLVVGGGGRKR